MDIRRATRGYDSWIARRLPLLRADLREKHRRMAADPFSFLRATFYRWVQRFPETCPEVARAPVLLAVGDIHVENYGTWRDGEGRLVWGANDFDEAYPLPYTNDLVRLATSVRIAARTDHLSIAPARACRAILDGYAEAIGKGGAPFVLAERNGWLRAAVTDRARDPVAYWNHLAGLPPARRVPPTVATLLRAALPDRRLPVRIAHRMAGLGSLGRPRYTALCEWRGGWIAREAKPLLPSAAAWAQGANDPSIHWETLVRKAVRTPDPFLELHGRWLVRRLSPYCSRIELRDLGRSRDEERLAWAMGFELANVHLGNPRAAGTIRRDLDGRRGKWLRTASDAMARGIVADWKDWKRSMA